MANINVDQVRSAAAAVNKKSEDMTDISESFDKIISAVQTGWTGTGSEDFISRLQMLKDEANNIVRNTSEIAAILSEAANKAEEYDRKMREQFDNQKVNGNSGNYTSDRLIHNTDGSVVLRNDCGNLNQHTQNFTHGENAGVECTSTALAQCNNINGGTYKTANDYNDQYGNTQIGFYQSGSSQIKRYCEENLKQGRATCIYYNYGNTDSSTPPGQYGHCVTVVGSINSGSDIIEDLIVIDPATGEKVQLSSAVGFPTGHAKNLFVACETTIHGSATQRSEIEGRLEVWAQHGV